MIHCGSAPNLCRSDILMVSGMFIHDMYSPKNPEILLKITEMDEPCLVHVGMPHSKEIQNLITRGLGFWNTEHRSSIPCSSSFGIS